MDAYNTINDILVHLFNEIWELEKKAIITEEFKDITNNDMHIISNRCFRKDNDVCSGKEDEDYGRVSDHSGEWAGKQEVCNACPR